ncbi:hypothetical protein Tco_0312205 [Tanacetum coccineum]
MTMTPDRRQALKEKVSNLLKEGIIRRVQYPEWVANAKLIKLANEEEELASLMGYRYNCFLRLPKDNSQIKMAEDDAGFHTEEGLYCFTHMPKGLKNFVVTLQRMMENVLANQKG